MSTKSFKNIRKPARQPTAEEIAGFEATGRAARKPHPDAISTETQKSASPETHTSVDVENREPVSLETLLSGDTEPRISVIPETRKSGNAESSGPANTETGEGADPEIRAESEPIVRLTVDLPESAHLRFKAACALSRRTMVQEVRELIEQRTRVLEDQRAR